MITNLIFDLSAYGGSANFTATTPTDLINELNTLTGVTWFWDPLDCKPKSNFYGGALTPIPTQYIISLVDNDNDSTGFCNLGALDYTKFTEINLSAYGGSANTSVSNSADIISAFAALTPSLSVVISGCNIIIDNWDRNNIPTNVEVNNTAGCTITTIEMPGFNFSSNTNYETGAPIPAFQYGVTYVKWGNGTDVGPVTVDWGDGNIITYPDPGYASTYSYLNPGNYTIVASYTDIHGNPVTITDYITIDAVGNVKSMKNNTDPSPRSIRFNDIQTPFNFDTSNCAAVTWSMTNVSGWSIVNTGTTYELEITVGGNTTSFSGPLSGASLIANFVNVPFNYVGSGAYPITANFKCDGVITGIYTGNIYLS